MAHLVRSPLFAAAVILIVIVGGAAAALYVRTSSSRISIDKAEISAPLIPLSAPSAGPLKNVFVHEGDDVGANVVVAQVGNDLIKSTAAGKIVLVNNNIGKLFDPGEPVVEMVQSDQLRVEAQVEEDKGLKDIAVGERATFTVDAFGSKQYEGIVDEVSPAPLETGVAFSISDKRAMKNYIVKIRFDRTQYPEITYGMSAQALIYKQ